MRVSLVTTVLNEEKSIKSFLVSISKQTRKPDEVVIVDAGSTDNTRSILAAHIKEYPCKVILRRGNRSIGRNEAVKRASGDIIAVSDVGCILDKNWLKNIVGPFKTKSIDVVAGFYKPLTNTVFEKSLATYTCTMPDKVRPDDFLPSSRSVAFRKDVWKRAGGYPEELDTCEDLVFDKRLKQAGAKFVFARNAMVMWPQKKNIFEAVKQFYSYAKGDGQALYIRPQTPLLFARYVAGTLLVILFLASKSNFLLSFIFYLSTIYLVWSIYKNYKYVNNLKAIIYLPVLQFTSDIAVISGFLVGLKSRK